MIKETIDKIKDAENRAERLVTKACADAEGRIQDFAKERASRLGELSRRNEALRQRMIERAEKEAAAQESEILARAQEEMNALRAAADRKKEEAVLFIVRTIQGQ
jgi:vacuolar-type H+-ATPase subunit H